jgi:hypothetical protein
MQPKDARSTFEYAPAVVKQKTAEQSGCSQLKLPPELKNMIWELIVHDAAAEPLDLRHFRPPAITQVCGHMRSESRFMIVPALVGEP